jgi:ferredoxin
MGAILYFIETTLLWIVAVVLIAGLAWRLTFFLAAILRKRTFTRYGSWQRLVSLTSMLAPFHRAILAKPAYAALRYTFHACLFIIPIWFSGHIYLWEESRFEWYWSPLPDIWVDWMTLAVLGACAYFLVRRIVAAKRLKTRTSDIMLIVITALPFLSGYLLTHGQLSDIPFFDSYLWYLHVFSAEIMLLMIVLLFCRTHLSKEKCVGCAACVENCPTETLEFNDLGPDRFILYSHFQCICCGNCVKVCPEQAAGLRHDLHPKHLFQIVSKPEIRKVELKACSQCGIRFAPNPQIDKLVRQLHQDEMEIETLDLCLRCKKIHSGRNDLNRVVQTAA